MHSLNQERNTCRQVPASEDNVSQALYFLFRGLDRWLIQGINQHDRIKARRSHGISPSIVDDPFAHDSVAVALCVILWPNTGA